MALSDRNIVITPNRGRADDPKIEFSGANANVSAQTITLRVYPDNAGTLSFEGSAGQLFAITNDLSGTLFRVNDSSGIPSLEINADGTVTIAEFSGNVGIGTGSPVADFHVQGETVISGRVGIGTANVVTLNSNILSVYGTAMVFGNIDLANPAGGTSGIYFNDGTYQTTLAVNRPSFGAAGTVQFAGAGNIFSGDTANFFWDDTNNRLGLGTQSPASTLDVRGGVGVTAASNFGGTVTVASLTSNGAVSGTTGTFTGALYGASFNTAGTATVNALVSNGAISGTTITGTAATLTSSQNSGIETVNGLVSNVFGRFGQNVTIASTNVSISTTTGALTVAGGAGIAGNIWTNGNVVLGGGVGAVNQFWGNNNDSAARPSFTWGSNTSSGMFLPNTNTVAFSTGGTERMRIDNAGDIKVGTVSGTNKIEVGVILFSNNQAANGIVIKDTSDQWPTKWTIESDAGGVPTIRHTFITSDYITYRTNSGIYLGFSTAGIERMRIDGSGNVGIATTTVQTGFTLQTQGNQSVSNRIGVGTTAIAGVVNTAAIFGTANIHGNVRLLTPTGGTAGVYFADGTYQTTAFTGTASTPSFGTVGTIQVAGAANIFTGDSGAFVFDVANDRLGIGTASPTNSLSVWSTATPAFFNTLNSAVSSNNYEILVGNGTSTGTTLGYVNNTVVPYGYLSAGTTTRNIIIAANGRVGIGGVTAPQNLLDVGGTVVIGASFAGNSNFINAPASGLAVQGSVGIGTYTPLSSLDVRGGVGVTGASNFGGIVSVANLVSNAWIHATQNLTVASSNASITTATGAAVVTGGVGIGGNINVGGTRNLFTGSVGVGTSAVLGTTSNVLSVYGTAMVFGNIDLGNPTGGTSGIYFADGTYQVSANGPAFSLRTSNYTAVNGDKLLCDTSGGTFTVTLPAGPVFGDTILIYDRANFTTNPLNIARNGATIEGVADDFILDIGQTKNEIVYDGSTWHIYVSIGPRGLPGSNASTTSSIAYSIALG